MTVVACLFFNPMTLVAIEAFCFVCLFSKGLLIVLKCSQNAFGEGRVVGRGHCGQCMHYQCIGIMHERSRL